MKFCFGYPWQSESSTFSQSMKGNTGILGHGGKWRGGENSILSKKLPWSWYHNQTTKARKREWKISVTEVKSCSSLPGKEYIASYFCCAYWYHLQKIYHQLKEGYIPHQCIPPRWCLDFQEFIRCSHRIFFEIESQCKLLHFGLIEPLITLFLYILISLHLFSYQQHNKFTLKQIVAYLSLCIPPSMYTYNPHTNTHIHTHKTWQWIAEFTERQEKKT